MNDKFDEMMSNYFAGENIPSEKLKAEIQHKLIIAQQKKNRKQQWMAVVEIILSTIAVSFLISVFAGSIIAIYAGVANLLFSIMGSILIMLISKREQVWR